MKVFLLLGGTSGFLLSFASGLFAGNEITIALRDGAIGCLAGVLLMKVLCAVVFMCIQNMAEKTVKVRAGTIGVDVNN
jgi:hypothetical protein